MQRRRKHFVPTPFWVLMQ